MQNIYWRWLSWIAIFMIFFAIGYSFGFAGGSKQTFDFFVAFIDYSVQNGILKMEINISQLENYLKLAEKYCFRNSHGSRSLNFDVIRCD